MVDLIGYCLKCKTKTKMDNVKEVTMKNGRNAAKGNCKCGTSMFKILGGPSKSKSSKSKSSKSKSSKSKSSKSKPTKSKSIKKSKKTKSSKSKSIKKSKKTKSSKISKKV